ncbi:MAG: DUF1178 family protein [Betaproteobacteria bacterium]|nr:DUF1178 family protein [Betaproteobacteria bacterium]
MKVLDLQCVGLHSFEGWFGSEEDFQNQLSCGLVACPMCGSVDVVKKLSAPRLNLRTVKPAGDLPVSVAAEPPTPPVDPSASSMQHAWLNLVQAVMANTEDVGRQFAEEARKIHYGETKERAIRGQASHTETEALLEEGISVVPLALPAALKGSLQ